MASIFPITPQQEHIINIKAQTDHATMMAIIQLLREKIPIFSNAPKREFARLILQNLTLAKQHFTVIPYDDEYIFITTKAEKYLIEEVPSVLLAHTLTIYRKMENLTYSKPNLGRFS